MRRGGSRAGLLPAALLILAGLGLIGLHVYWVWYPGAPLEEPANPGNTPDPSQAPWTYDREREEQEYRKGRITAKLVIYGLPAAGFLLLGIGAALLAGSGRSRAE